jgi:O-antigen ligase
MIRSKPLVLSKFVVYLALISSVFMVNFLDPINWPKQILLVVLLPWLCWVAYQDSQFSTRDFFKSRIFKVLIVSSLLVFLASLFSFENMTRFLWGSWGRNNGLLTTLSLIVLAFLTSNMAMRKDFLFKLLATIEIFVLVAGIYGLLQKFGLDPVQWSSENQVFSFFGNTNFASAIFAMGAIASLSLGLYYDQRKPYKFLQIILFLFSALMTYLTGSLQGMIAISLALFFMAYLALYQISVKLGKSFLGLGILLAALVLPGFAGVGILGTYIEQYTIKLRFQYWLIGLEMGSRNLLSGVGVDAYGDSYRENRSLDLIRETTLDLTTNNAHNTIVQFFATLGILGLIAILVPFGLALFRSMLIIWKPTDRAQYSIVIIFISLWSMAMISIDNIAVAIWNWTFLGAVLGMSGSNAKIVSKENSKASGRKVKLYEPMKLGAGALSVLLFAFSWAQTIPEREILKAKLIYVPEGDQNGPIVQKRKIFQKLLSLDTLMENEYFELASEMSKEGDWPYSVDLLEKATGKYPKNFFLLDALAATRENNGLISEAIPVRIAQIELDSNHAVVWFYLGRNYMKVKNFSMAYQAFTKSLGLKEFLSPEFIQATNSYLEEIQNQNSKNS